MTSRALHERLARLLAHQQVDVALAVAELGVLQAVERVRQRAADLREQHELVDCERRLAALRLHRRARRADDVAEVDVDCAGAFLLAEELDPPGAVDEVEEDELAHVAPREYAAGDTHVPSPVSPGSSGSAAARTAATSSRSGNRLGRDIAGESRGTPR